MKLESLKLEKFQENELKIDEMQILGSCGSGGPCRNERTGGGSTIHTGSSGHTSHVNYGYDVIRWASGGHTTFHDLTPAHPNGGECQLL